MLSTDPYNERKVEKYSCVLENAIAGPGLSRDYAGWPNTVNCLGLMKLSTMSPLEFPQALSTVVANNVSKLSMMKLIGVGYLNKIYLLLPGRKQIGYGSTPVPATIVLSLEFKYFYVIGGP